MIDRIRREPVLVTALAQAILVCAVAFGLDLSDAQTASILGVSAAVLAVIARSQVTPVEKTAPTD